MIFGTIVPNKKAIFFIFLRVAQINDNI